MATIFKSKYTGEQIEEILDKSNNTTDIQANNGEPTTADLHTLKIGDKNYKIPEQTNVDLPAVSTKSILGVDENGSIIVITIGNGIELVDGVLQLKPQTVGSITITAGNGYVQAHLRTADGVIISSQTMSTTGDTATFENISVGQYIDFSFNESSIYYTVKSGCIVRSTTPDGAEIEAKDFYNNICVTDIEPNASITVEVTPLT